MIKKAKQNWANEKGDNAYYGDDAGLIATALSDMSQILNASVSSLEAVIGKIEIPKSDPEIARNIKALSAKLNKPPVVNLAAPDLSDLKAAITEIGTRQGKVLSVIEALIRILNEPKQQDLKEFTVEVDRNTITNRIQSMIIKQVK